MPRSMRAKASWMISIGSVRKSNGNSPIEIPTRSCPTLPLQFTFVSLVQYDEFSSEAHGSPSRNTLLTTYFCMMQSLERWFKKVRFMTHLSRWQETLEKFSRRSAQRTSSSEFFVDDQNSEPLIMPEGAPRDFRDSARRIWSSLARRPKVVAILLVVLYIAWFIHLNLQSYYTYGEPPFDLAIFDQGLWLISHFHVPFVTVMGRNLFGDHTSFVLYLFAPFYRLFPEPQGLLILQTFLVAGPTVPILSLIHISEP